MLNKLFVLNKLYITTVISLLICALFFSYYNLNSSIEVFKKNIESNQNCKVTNSETAAKAGGNTNKLRFANLRFTETEKDDQLLTKKLGFNHQSPLGRKWMFCYFYIINILYLSIIILYSKGWFIKVLRSTYQFYQVHYIQLKDGKKECAVLL